MRSIKRLYSQTSIRRKILSIILILSIVPIVSFAYVSYNIYRTTIVDRSIKQAEDNNSLVLKQLENIINDAESAATILTININNVYDNQASGPDRNNVKLYNLISNELDYAKLVFPYIDDIAFVDTQNTVHFTDEHKNYDHMNLYGSPLITTLHDNNGRNQWFDMEKRGYLVTSEEAVLTLGKKVWDMDSGETLGFLIINIKAKTIGAIFDNQMMAYTIYSNKFIELNGYDSLPKDILLTFAESSKSTEIKGDLLMTKHSIERLNWTVIGFETIHTFISDLNTIVTTVIFMIVLIILIELILGQYLSKMITIPIMELKKNVEKVSQGDFKVNVNVKTQDEIGLFAASFNNMSKRINNLILEVEQEAETKRHYELALMHQQIKPHFLYNTLDIIIKLSEMGKPKASQRAAKRLANYYQKSLSSGANIISLRDELSLTKDYIELQQIRYSSLFDYVIDVEDSLMDHTIPKLTLQPLVENAIYHGFKYIDDKGLLRISTEIFNESFNLYIEDNGQGMDDETLTKLTEKKSFSKDHFGLYNVKDRIELTFGKQYSLNIESKKGIGTKVTISLPLEDNDD